MVLPVNRKAMAIVNKVRRTARVKGAGINFLKANSIYRVVLIIGFRNLLKMENSQERYKNIYEGIESQ
ncbi:hypothetical protein GFO_0738 [Christiangramia forsetii KT0803]|uniref:Uncharacterized protein n=2 Tax=Christiangramia forsetii TaxID=411153 RepID=A0LZC0_CHRFK|nr:hypothetical protein GFO_0738 [Christiangramia forsetii KT0803]